MLCFPCPLPPVGGSLEASSCDFPRAPVVQPGKLMVQTQNEQSLRRQLLSYNCSRVRLAPTAREDSELSPAPVPAVGAILLAEER